MYKLAPRAFADPALYLSRPELPAEVDALYTLVVDNAISPSSPLPGGGLANPTETLISIRKTSALGPIWREAGTGGYAVWRYVATPGGLHRLFPAYQIENEYDPTSRPWYLSLIHI